MNLRKFIKVATLCVASIGLVACSNQKSENSSEKSFKVGIIQYAEHEALTSSRKGFIEALEESGFKEGKNLEIKLENAQGDQANLQTSVSLMTGKNNLNFAIATPAAQALLNADPKTPSVFTAVTDPVKAGLVNSLEKPGTNMTGSIDATDVVDQIELLVKVVPNAKKIGVFYNSSEVNSEVQAKIAKESLEKKGIDVVEKTVTSTNDVQTTVEILASQVDAIYFPTDNTVASTIATIGEVLKKAEVVGMGSDAAVIEGVLFTYGVDYHSIGKQAGELAAKILKGEKPADLAVQKPNKASIEVNEEMAKILNISPDSIKNLAK